MHDAVSLANQGRRSSLEEPGGDGEADGMTDRFRLFSSLAVAVVVAAAFFAVVWVYLLLQPRGGGTLCVPLDGRSLSLALWLMFGWVPALGGGLVCGATTWGLQAANCKPRDAVGGGVLLAVFLVSGAFLASSQRAVVTRERATQNHRSRQRQRAQRQQEQQRFINLSVDERVSSTLHADPARLFRSLRDGRNRVQLASASTQTLTALADWLQQNEAIKAQNVELGCNAGIDAMARLPDAQASVPEVLLVARRCDEIGTERRQQSAATAVHDRYIASAAWRLAKYRPTLRDRDLRLIGAALDRQFVQTYAIIHASRARAALADRLALVSPDLAARLQARSPLPPTRRRQRASHRRPTRHRAHHRARHGRGARLRRLQRSLPAQTKPAGP